MDDISSLTLQGHKPADNRLPTFRIQDAERQIFQLFAHPLHAHATGERRVYVHRLTGLLGLFVRTHRLDRAHIVETVSEFDQNNPQVFGHGHEQLAKVLGLLGFATA